MRILPSTTRPIHNQAAPLQTSRDALIGSPPPFKILRILETLSDYFIYGPSYAPYCWFPRKKSPKLNKNAKKQHFWSKIGCFRHKREHPPRSCTNFLMTRVTEVPTYLIVFDLLFQMQEKSRRSISKKVRIALVDLFW